MKQAQTTNLKVKSGTVYHQTENSKYSQYVPFDKSSLYVKPLKAHSSFYVKKKEQQDHQLKETFVQISVNLGKKTKVNYVDAVDPVTNIATRERQEKDFFVVTCYENNYQTKYKTYNSLEEAEKFMSKFLEKFSPIKELSDSEKKNMLDLKADYDRMVKETEDNLKAQGFKTYHPEYKEALKELKKKELKFSLSSYYFEGENKEQNNAMTFKQHYQEWQKFGLNNNF